MAGEPLVVCENLQRRYGDYAALKGVSFSVARGEFAAVMGPSGCGKSTLLALLGLLDRPTGGRYLLGGADAAGLPDAEITRLRRERIGFVFQAYNLLPRLSALENVALPMAYAGVPLEERRDRARRLLFRVGLEAKASSTPLELSGGERQRVGIARSLSNSPALLLADEPTGNLDSKSSADVMAFFKELHAEGLTILLVTHDAAVGAGAQRILRLKDGLLA
ncbi:MAG TPA: ABC transporter ATP-binding protein [Elusimicrobiota bacterium]|jgi:putative ABC transport system ATP-binding protein|nr:ABC transporter ATP-binding protein [Elusimicrobiota bacterium]